jgi:hypothetical protein
MSLARAGAAADRGRPTAPEALDLGEPSVAQRGEFSVEWEVAVLLGPCGEVAARLVLIDLMLGHVYRPSVEDERVDTRVRAYRGVEVEQHAAGRQRRVDRAVDALLELEVVHVVQSERRDDRVGCRQWVEEAALLEGDAVAESLQATACLGEHLDVYVEQGDASLRQALEYRFGQRARARAEIEHVCLGDDKPGEQLDAGREHVVVVRDKAVDLDVVALSVDVEMALDRMRFRHGSNLAEAVALERELEGALTVPPSPLLVASAFLVALEREDLGVANSGALCLAELCQPLGMLAM